MCSNAVCHALFRNMLYNLKSDTLVISSKESRHPSSSEDEKSLSGAPSLCSSMATEILWRSQKSLKSESRASSNSGNPDADAVSAADFSQ